MNMAEPSLEEFRGSYTALLANDLVERSVNAVQLARVKNKLAGKDDYDRVSFCSFRFKGLKYETDILGFEAIAVVHKDIPDASFDAIMDSGKSVDMIDAELARFPGFIVELCGFKRTADRMGEPVFIFFTPDSPPMAVFAADIEQATGAKPTISTLDQSDLWAVHVAFDGEGIMMLSEEDCRKLYEAERTFDIEVY